MPRRLGALALAIALAVLAASVARAQANKQANKEPAAPPAPTMSAEGKKFVQGWLGQWTSSDASLTAGAQKMQGPLRMSCESVSSGWGTLCKGTFELKGMPPSASTFLMGWDVATGTGHMFEISDTGELHDHSGKWADGKSITLVHEGKTPAGPQEKDSCTATWASARELKFDCTGTQAGVPVWTFTSTSRK
jgi:hypothetical protein